MDNSEIIIRKAVSSDVYMIKKITAEAFASYGKCVGISETIPALNETVEDVERDIKTKIVLVAEYNDILVGGVRVEIKHDNTAYLSRFSVSVEHQNHGIGKLLLNEVDKVMKDRGVKMLYLHTASKILSLIQFYYSRGFYIDSTTKDRGYIRALLCKSYEEASYGKSNLYGTYVV
ncbi:GNAT family N-acetyltransferase [Clostridium sp. 19966]|uniref:GNAT family N-acetyltransferase n=1 Tax=Clostridium sp. 19966 TaxID=2768166 RepID=UPI0028E023BD|nr:GNAT family N-acetyltransferase [Clostridium sp. 19966]MDT8718738.1 GNAT family N-acetyltransferase [Clostridium sp. 19966]